MRALPFLMICCLAFSCSSKKKERQEEPPVKKPVAGVVPVSPSASFRFTTAVDELAGPSEAPISLTASDGTGLTMVALDARGVVEHPLAFTELRMTFENPRNETIEGQFRITLPTDAAISRFAMKIGETWQEGEVVEKMAARRAYEDFLHRRQDPALLEQAAGNEFQARVFPIPARGKKELILSYSHELEAASEEYTIPLRGLPQIGKVDVSVTAGRDSGDPKIVKEHFDNWVPDRDISVESTAPDRRGLRADGVAIVRVSPQLGDERDEFESLLVLIDTSASRALGYGKQTKKFDILVKAFAAGAGPDVPLAVAAFDQQTELIYEGKAGGFGDADLRKLADRRALGASDIEAALTWAKGRSASYDRLIIVTDGVVTAGKTTADELRKAAAALGESGIRRIDALAIGGIRDEALLKALVTSGLKDDGAVVDGDGSLVEISDRLTRKVQSNIEVSVPGASWVWPKHLDAIQTGDEALVYAGIDGTSDIEIQVNGVKSTPKLAGVAEAPRPLLQRAAARARIAAMLAEQDALPADDHEGRKALKERIIGLSTRHRVLSPYTALLVLETEADYARFSIDRKSLAGILTVDKGALAVVNRNELVLPSKDDFRTRTVDVAVAAPGEDGDDDLEKKVEEEEAEADFGGTGTKMALDEGKMGRKDSTRASGQFAMRNNNADPQLAREQAMDSARRAGILGALNGSGAASGSSGLDNSAPAPRALEPEPSPPGDVGRRRRTADRREVRSRRPAPRPAQPATDDPLAGLEDIDSLLATSREEPQKPEEEPYTGKMAEVMQTLPKQPAQALAAAWAWRAEEPGNVMALIALGECLEKTGDPRAAARAYGSIIDLFSARADLRRFAGQRLERLKEAEAAQLAVDTFHQAVLQRPDHPSSHRLYAYSLLRTGKHADAFAAMEAGLEQSYPSGRFAGARQILSEDLGLIAAAWIKAEGDRKSEILKRLKSAGGTVEDAPSLRFVLNWETDANDVDFHIYDGKGNHAFYRSPRLASGGHLYADVTTGYGPECFTIRGKASAHPYTLQAHYYSRGPMGYGMGKLEVVKHDGKGGLTFEQRPFVIMKDGAFIDMGRVTN